MRKTIIFLLLFVVFCSCESKKKEPPCEFYLLEKTDEFDKSKVYESQFVNFFEDEDLFKGNLQFLSIDLNSYYISLKLKDVICTDPESKVIFLFHDETTHEYNAINDYSCDGHILLKEPIFNDFENKKVKGFRIKGYKQDLDFYITNEASIDLQKTASCYYKVATEIQNKKHNHS